jgi:hypothetical protein
MKRRTYHLNITERQMRDLQALVKQERQRLAIEQPDIHNRVMCARDAKSLQAALDRSVYFHDKHADINGTVDLYR